jgi:hypothetical protein
VAEARARIPTLKNARTFEVEAVPAQQPAGRAASA